MEPLQELGACQLLELPLRLHVTMLDGKKNEKMKKKCCKEVKKRKMP
jgi:hypothetical protein